MPFDTMAMVAVTDELSGALNGGRVQRIIQPSATSIALAIYAHGNQQWVVLSADPRFARVSLSSDRLAKAFATPSPFVMLLRKYLDGARLTEVRQVPGERIVIASFASGEDQVELVTEVMGKHSNVILLAGGRILGALKTVPIRQSRVRPVAPGLTYLAPPAQLRDEKLFPPGPRLDPFTHPDLVGQALASVPPDTSLKTALLGLLVGASPFLAGQILTAADLAPDSTGANSDLRALVTSARQFYELYASHAWKPSTFTNARGQRDFAPYHPLGMAEVQSSENMSAAIDRCLGANESHDSLASTRTNIVAQIERVRRSAERRLASLREGLAASADAEDIMIQGQLILAYQHLIASQAREVTIPDLDLTIPLDPSLSASENAERTFKRYHKLRDAASRVPELIAETERELDRLHDLAAFVGIAASEAELRALEREIAPGKDQHKSTPRARDRARGPGRFVNGGYTVIVGRNARENEEVTFRLAGRDDLWLHVRERTGAHVIVQGADRNVPDEIIENAAALAAYFSEGRSDSAVDVDIARPRDVRKIPGGPPGRVTYRNFRTVRVQPTLAGWEALSGKR